MTEPSKIIEKLQKKAENIFESIDILKVIGIDSMATKFFNQDVKLDFVVQVETKERENYHICFITKSSGQPRFARGTAYQLQFISHNQKNIYGVFGAPYISDEAKRICQELGVGYLDLAGNCFFKFNNVFISVEGKPNPYPTKRQQKSIFSPRSTRFLRVLLCNPKREWYVKEIAQEAKISLGHASNLKKLLLNDEFIKEIKSNKVAKFCLTNPERLLKEWTDNYSFNKNKQKNYYSLEDVKTIEKKISKYCDSNEIRYALTLTSGASLVAPFLRYKKAFAYIGNSIEKVASNLAWKEVPSGSNITVLEPYDEGIFYGLQEINGIKVVSSIQLYLDLKGYKERGEEAAQFLLENVLRKQW
jgi:hypothetical protein